MSRPEPRTYLTSVRSDVARVAGLVEGLAEGDDPAVPACPGWGLRSLVAHLGGVHRMVTAATTGVSSRSVDHLPADGTHLGPWLREGAEAMLATLDVDPATSAWSFDPDGRTVGFWQRRQAVETLVHRVDAEQATSSPTPVAPEVAADGVAEVLDTLVRLRTAAGVVEAPSRAVEIVATDTGDRWCHGPGEPQARVSGRAGDLLLALWKRPLPEGALELDGDSALARAMLASSLTP
ncbi:maleylpyruvate isomerase family mycothiol-dependent enzyme [Phycicoccus sp. CSK15P-2]|uniref:maleylpyruvate isomerase family mycothiol-dependent enzyme n=1 Tax=Phycicoccus sp. CSK15P-2 TaxID=2807627 RepID=UPI0019528694|nr:maleylpyruvate isomerase family mycothiol-dependent enzyme [Phycicoccus sp. CSK15P-2]MBM6402785.1 maleylpyruvate isomerase family mycothiol-dependent enzyme [Phycicoccus sp. CSK15P-2]